MSGSARADGSGVVGWLRGLWVYYRGYTHTAVHTAAAAALTGFGLLVFVDPLFVVLAIASYVCPPVVLYVLDADLGQPDASPSGPGRVDAGGSGREHTPTDTDGDTDTDAGDGDTDSDSGDGDTDSDADA